MRSTNPRQAIDRDWHTTDINPSLVESILPITIMEDLELLSLEDPKSWSAQTRTVSLLNIST